MYKEAVDVGLLLGEGIDGSGHVGKPQPFGVFLRSSGGREVNVRNGGGVESGMTMGASLWRRGMSGNSCPEPDSMSVMCFWNSSSFAVSSAFWVISDKSRLASATHGCGGVTVTGKGAGVTSVVPCATLDSVCSVNESKLER